jgi:hypothetical protein
MTWVSCADYSHRHYGISSRRMEGRGNVRELKIRNRFLTWGELHRGRLQEVWRALRRSSNHHALHWMQTGLTRHPGELGQIWQAIMSHCAARLLMYRIDRLTTAGMTDDQGSIRRQTASQSA